MGEGNDEKNMEEGSLMDGQPGNGDTHCSLVSPGNDLLVICPDTETKYLQIMLS